jgi:phosphoribosylformimino-5-aminoimidazole carboxamide ribotide isomerase
MIADSSASGSGVAAAARGFEVIPAIDLREGRVVRLAEGDFQRETAYSADPVGVARSLEAQGAGRLHVVDLDGAAAGRPMQSAVIEGITRSVGIPVQVAGGLRHAEAVARAFAAGADRVVLGSALLRDPTLAAVLASRYGARLVAAIDVRDETAVGDAWLPGAPGRPVRDAVQGLGAAGVTVFAVTAVARDGGMAGPDLGLLERVLGWADGACVIASAGIASVSDLRAVRALGCSGAIIGRALYEGRIELREALEAAH